MKKYIFISFLLFFAISGCKKKDNPIDNSAIDLELISQYTINVPEPSGLAFSADKNHLWTVSDNTGKIYLLSLQGVVQKEIDIKGNDMEGITAINNEKLAVVYEESREVVIVDTAGNKKKTKKINVSKDFDLGLEGITYNSAEDQFYAVNEKDPMLLMRLDNDLDTIKTWVMNFSTDLSDITYDETENVYWILSHESKLLVKFDPRFNILEKYKVPAAQPEGVAVDYMNKLIYIVSDSDNQLFVFRIK